MQKITLAAVNRQAPVDPDDTTRCPVALCCDTCGITLDLDVATVQTPVGICCTTLCGQCDDDDRLPSWLVAHAVRQVFAHAGHLGCTVEHLDGTSNSR